jgi:hypothetical protein
MDRLEKIDLVMNKYEIKKIDREVDNKYPSVGYDYKIHLSNLNLDWYLRVELPTRKCKFFTLYTLFYNKETDYKDIDLFKVFKVSDNGKYNSYVYSIHEIECVINNIITYEKMEKYRLEK